MIDLTERVIIRLPRSNNPDLPLDRASLSSSESSEGTARLPYAHYASAATMMLIPSHRGCCFKVNTPRSNLAARRQKSPQCLSAWRSQKAPDHRDSCRRRSSSLASSQSASTEAPSESEQSIYKVHLKVISLIDNAHINEAVERESLAAQRM